MFQSRSLGFVVGCAQCTPFDGLVLLCGNLSAAGQLCPSRTLGSRTGNFSLSTPDGKVNRRPAARNTNVHERELAEEL
jgi:hypothetical protein